MTTKGDIRLDDEVRDRITGFEGVVVAITEWNNGCQRLTVQARKLHDGKPIDAVTFDIEDLELVRHGSKSNAQPSGGPPVRANDPTRRAGP